MAETCFLYDVKETTPYMATMLIGPSVRPPVTYYKRLNHSLGFYKNWGI
jgi:hypothetical protein